MKDGVRSQCPVVPTYGLFMYAGMYGISDTYWLDAETHLECPDKQQGEHFRGPDAVGLLLLLVGADAASALATAAAAAAALPQDEAGHVGAAAEHVIRPAAPAAKTRPARGAPAGRGGGRTSSAFILYSWCHCCCVELTKTCCCLLDSLLCRCNFYPRYQQI